MAITRTVKIDAEVESIGQYDRIETCERPVEVRRLDGGRVRLGDTTFLLEDLLDALSTLT